MILFKFIYLFCYTNIYDSLINFKFQNNIYRKKFYQELAKILKKGDFILGYNVSLLEKKIAKYVNTKYCISCSSGTDALLMSLMAYNIKPGDVVFTIVYSYISTAEVIEFLGATPVFIDIDPATYNMDSSDLANTIKNIKKKFYFKYSKEFKKKKQN